MQKENNKPIIRFKGYTDAWEQRKVGELLIERNEQAPMSEEYPLMAFIANEGVAPKGERYDRSSLVSDTENKLYKRTEFGDFIYSSNNLETGSIGLNKYGKASISPVYSIFCPTGIADSDFLGRRLVRKDFINAMVKWRQGVIYGQWRIHESDFLKIEIPVPLIKEQRKIGAFFHYIDNLITLHQRKYEKLKNIKKSMLEKMFPKKGSNVPEIRFNGFTDAWEQRKLDEILIQRVEHQIISTDAPLLAFSYEEGVINPEDKKSNKRDFIMTDKFSKVFSRTELNDIIYNPANVIHGAIHRNKLGTGVVSPIYKIFICNNVSPLYMGERLHTDKFIKEITKYIEGTVIKLRTLSPEMFLDMKIEIPLLYEEQERIGIFLEQLNCLITLHQRKLEKLQNIKKACLDKMFV